MNATDSQYNHLALYRRKRGFSQKHVALLIGHKTHSAVSLYEHGRAIPPLITALKLEIVLRTPVAFLFPSLYRDLKETIRGEEDRMAGIGQQVLFPEY